MKKQAMADGATTAASGLFPPGESFPEGMRPLFSGEIDAFLREFSERERADALLDSDRGEGVAVDMRNGHEFKMLGMMLVVALSVFSWIGGTFGHAIPRWSFLVALPLLALILVWLAAQILVDRVFLLFQSGNVFFRADRGFHSSRRLLRSGDIQKILHGERKSQDPVSCHSAEFLLANGERLFLLNADTDRGKAVWFLNVLQRRLNVPVELETTYGIGCIPADESESQSGRKREPEQKAVAGASGGAFVPDVREHFFVEFAVLLPGTTAYEKFRRKVDSTSALHAMHERSGFIVRETKLTALAYFFATLLLLAAVWIFTKEYGPTGRTAIILSLLIASLVSVLAVALTDKRHFFFTAEMLLICRKSGMVLREIPRKSIADVHARRVLAGFLISDDAREEWKVSVEVAGEKIPLKDFRNTRDAKWLVDAMLAWVNHIPAESHHRAEPAYRHSP